MENTPWVGDSLPPAFSAPMLSTPHIRSQLQRVLGPLTEAHLQLFLKNPRFVGLKFPDMSRPETLQKRFVGKVRN